MKQLDRKSFLKKDEFLIFGSKYKTDRISSFLGILFILFMAIVVTYFGSKRLAYIRQFYPVYFKINFIEGIKPGIKIRYQGGVVVGVVDKVESNYSTHLLHARIKKDFFIPKKGTKVSINNFGAFGKTYIDITSVVNLFDAELYKPNDIIPITEIVPFQVSLQNFSNMIEQKNGQTYSPLSKKLISIRNMIGRFKNNPYSNPKRMRLVLKNFTHNVQKNLRIMNEYSLSVYDTVNNMSDSLTKVANSLKQSLPKINKRLNNVKSITNYGENKKAGSYYHDETLYWTTLNNIQAIHRALKKIKKEPYKLIFK